MNFGMLSIPFFPLYIYLIASNLEFVTSVNLCLGKIEFNFLMERGIRCTFDSIPCHVIRLVYFITSNNVLEAYFLYKSLQAIKIQTENAKSLIPELSFIKRKRYVSNLNFSKNDTYLSNMTSLKGGLQKVGWGGSQQSWKNECHIIPIWKPPKWKKYTEIQMIFNYFQRWWNRIQHFLDSILYWIESVNFNVYFLLFFSSKKHWINTFGCFAQYNHQYCYYTCFLFCWRL